MAKVNVDDAGQFDYRWIELIFDLFQGELATEYNISAVPTIMAFTNGECVGEFKVLFFLLLILVKKVCRHILVSTIYVLKKYL